jgi:hypothetical protein
MDARGQDTAEDANLSFEFSACLCRIKRHQIPAISALSARHFCWLFMSRHNSFVRHPKRMHGILCPVRTATPYHIKAFQLVDADSGVASQVPTGQADVSSWTSATNLLISHACVFFSETNRVCLR